MIFSDAQKMEAKLWDLQIFFQFQAKLPRGIENIRPHLKNVDNVPLLVNLFTDCTTESKNRAAKV